MAFKIFQCTGYEEPSVPETVLNKFKGSYQEVSNDSFALAKLAQAMKEHSGKPFCELPLGHTIEAESFGADVVLDPLNGNRLRRPIFTDISKISELKEMDVTGGRMAKVLEAIAILKKNGEAVVLNASGPVSLGTSLMDSQTFYKALRKNKPELQMFLDRIEEGILQFALAGLASGADLISLADPAGTMDILGPEVYRETAGKTMHSILKRLEKADALVHLCGRTSTSLAAAGFIRTEVIKYSGENYFTMLKNGHAEGLHIAGHWCLKSGRPTDGITRCILL